ncbi:Oligopeptide transport ATP-binding protein OppD [Pseudonocardia sp. Ae168_Ps1]|uniref:dipeptide/oligopeptide/nickel ABC transporter permease/ATP-binding protein n=1 Tax=unclassified Pseudonocardia TaxID=2619320 RepID=UPI0009650472|nr:MULTISPECIES: dipeptide/oligopeptide/nickel ABC transporter permease/ATP-binding protein [unclassified Pseudonocardia]OLL72016.1 Oligopeptide transport ATP-binding protein OppD [Pseudonocardia sp. Ae150A_Ps1]OLL77982.1 Oligopeptide transport ATP-binding protein OppD [Pseudonocardia sp. Ae168_Ps1]OLL87894.1 Oligopeptide transport ATP-binding protein OppD [Pseudonocardia sp. Ae263_Ps1]OLL92081.1 Oligopeptide transport ATP-binding protein OppD [Pseudonocardia sp. Ae356_Ps1]
MTEPSAPPVTPAAPGSAPRGRGGEVLRRLLRNPLGAAAATVLGLIVAGVLLADVLAPFEPGYADIRNILSGAGADHPLGTDSGGRDILSRLLHGGQTTLLAALLCAAVAIAVGVPSGLLAGYYAGGIDGAGTWVTNIILALPSMIVLLAVRAALGPSVWISMIVFGIMLAPGFFRLARTAVRAVRDELYIDAARVSGLSDARILRRHVLSVVRAPLIIQRALVCGIAIAVQSGLEFLGLGDAAVPTWGVMLNEGFRSVYDGPMTLVWPALAIVVTTSALVLLGNAVRDAVEDPARAGSAGAGGAVRQAVERRRAASAGTARDGGGHLLEVRDLGIAYPQADGTLKQVVDGVSFTLDRGEVLGVVGESGSGKSQTAFSVLGLLPGDALITGGTIRIDDELTVGPGDVAVDQDRLRPLRGRRIGYIPQEPMSNLDPAFTIGYQLVRPMTHLLGVSRAEATARAEELLRSVGIADPVRVMRSHPHEVSGGMAQRVLIAGAISCEPDLVIADEPTTALDVTVQAEVLDVLRDLQERLGLAVLLVTHNFGVVADLCDRVLVMRDGTVVESGDVRRILRDPDHEYTASLLDAMLADKPPRGRLTAAADENLEATR